MPKPSERAFRLILGLGFLPDSVRAWVFGTGTRALEVLNIGCLFGWSLVMLVDDRLLLAQTYTAFKRISASEWLNEALAAAFALLGVFCVIGLFCHHFRLKLLAGVAMLGSALAWALVTVGFVAGYPPLNTAVAIYGAFSFMCLLAGEHLIFEAQVTREAIESAPAPLGDQ